MGLHVTNKGRLILQSIARELLVLHFRGQDKILGIKEYADKFGVGVGTVQSAFQELKQRGAVQLNACGAQGTFLEQVDEKKLWEASDYRVLLAILSLDANRCIKGLATGIYEAFTAFDLPISILFARGAQNRVRILERDKCDFAVMSLLACEQALTEGDEVLPVGVVGAYPSQFGFLTRPGAEITGHTVIAYDSYSYDQEAIVSSYAGKATFLGDCLGVQLVDMVKQGDVEGALIEKSSAGSLDGLQFHPLGQLDAGSRQKLSQAAVVVRSGNENLRQLLQLVLSPELVSRTQSEVMEQRRVVKY